MARRTQDHTGAEYAFLCLFYAAAAVVAGMAFKLGWDLMTAMTS